MAGELSHCIAASSTKERKGEHKGSRRYSCWCRHCPTEAGVYLAEPGYQSAYAGGKAFEALGWVDDKVIGWLCPECAAKRKDADQDTADRMFAVAYLRYGGRDEQTVDEVVAKIRALRAEKYAEEVPVA